MQINHNIRSVITQGFHLKINRAQNAMSEQIKPDKEYRQSKVKQSSLEDDQATLQIAAQDAISMLEMYFGDDISKGKFDNISETSLAPDNTGRANDAINAINGILKGLSSNPTTDNIGSILDDLYLAGKCFRAFDLKFNVTSNFNLQTGTDVTAADKETIQKINQFMDDVFKTRFHLNRFELFA